MRWTPIAPARSIALEHARPLRSANTAVRSTEDVLMRQLILELAWEPLPPFAGFLPGDNAAVVAQLREQAWPGAPRYLWGPAGCGKTQLLHELQARAVQAGLVAQWFDASSSTPWELADDAALVLLDGVDQFGPDQQHAAFTLFVEAASRVGGVRHALADGVAGA